jgi:hypothetical protein
VCQTDAEGLDAVSNSSDTISSVSHAFGTLGCRLHWAAMSQMGSEGFDTAISNVSDVPFGVLGRRLQPLRRVCNVFMPYSASQTDLEHLDAVSNVSDTFGMCSSHIQRLRQVQNAWKPSPTSQWGFETLGHCLQCQFRILHLSLNPCAAVLSTDHARVTMPGISSHCPQHLISILHTFPRISDTSEMLLYERSPSEDLGPTLGTPWMYLRCSWHRSGSHASEMIQMVLTCSKHIWDASDGPEVGQIHLRHSRRCRSRQNASEMPNTAMMCSKHVLYALDGVEATCLCR